MNRLAVAEKEDRVLYSGAGTEREYGWSVESVDIIRLSFPVASELEPNGSH